MDWDDLVELDVVGVVVALVFTGLMYFFMFNLPADVGWGNINFAFKIIILVVGFPLYYVVSLAMLNK